MSIIGEETLAAAAGAGEASEKEAPEDGEDEELPTVEVDATGRGARPSTTLQIMDTIPKTLRSSLQCCDLRGTSCKMVAVLASGCSSGSTRRGCSTMIEPSCAEGITDDCFFWALVEQMNCAALLSFEVQANIDAHAEDTTVLTLPSGRQCAGESEKKNEVHTAHSRGATVHPALAGGADDGNADKNKNLTPAGGTGVRRLSSR